MVHDCNGKERERERERDRDRETETENRVLLSGCLLV